MRKNPTYMALLGPTCLLISEKSATYTIKWSYTIIWQVTVIIIQIWKNNWDLDPGISWLKYWGESIITEAKTDPSQDNSLLTLQQWLSRKSAVINGMCLSF